MFMPGDPVVLQGETGVLQAVEGHQVTVQVGDRLCTVAEHLAQRVQPADAPPRSSKISMLDPVIGSLLQEMLPHLRLDWNGHYTRGAIWREFSRWGRPEAQRRKELCAFAGFATEGMPALTLTDMQDLVQAWKRKRPLGHFIPVLEGLGYACPNCGMPAVFETNGRVLRPMTPCPCPDGVPVTEFTLNVPSGKVIINDDLRTLCRIPDRFDINYTWGAHQAILDYARNGMALGFGIGNTCPAVFEQGVGKYAIGCGLKGREIASVCTDLWAYSILDYAEAQRRATYYGLDLEDVLKEKHRCAQVVEIPAGVYRFHHFLGARRDKGPQMFAVFERVGAAVPPEDWCAKDAAFAVHLSQAVQIKAQQDQRGTSDWAATCAAVCMNEFAGCLPDRDWHRNGHRQDYVPEDLQGVPIREIPHFRFQRTWPLIGSAIETTVTRGGDAVWKQDLLINDSYALAAGRILESVISFGVPLRAHWPEEARETRARRLMTWAVAVWDGLVARYPHVAADMPEFAAWLEDRWAVAQWIVSFDLGPSPETPGSNC